MESKTTWRSILSVREAWIPFAVLWLFFVQRLPKELQLPFFLLLPADILLYRDIVTRTLSKTALKQ